MDAKLLLGLLAAGALLAAGPAAALSVSIGFTTPVGAGSTSADVAPEIVGQCVAVAPDPLAGVGATATACA